MDAPHLRRPQAGDGCVMRARLLNFGKNDLITVSKNKVDFAAPATPAGFQQAKTSRKVERGRAFFSGKTRIIRATTSFPSPRRYRTRRLMQIQKLCHPHPLAPIRRPAAKRPDKPVVASPRGHVTRYRPHRAPTYHPSLPATLFLYQKY